MKSQKYFSKAESLLKKLISLNKTSEKAFLALMKLQKENGIALDPFFIQNHSSVIKKNIEILFFLGEAFFTDGKINNTFYFKSLTLFSIVIGFIKTGNVEKKDHSFLRVAQIKFILRRFLIRLRLFKRSLFLVKFPPLSYQEVIESNLRLIFLSSPY